MKKWKRILSAALSVLLLSGSISVCAAERTYTDRSEVIGTAVVVGDEDSAGGSSLFSRPGTIATITPGKNHSYGSWGTCEFNVKTETGNHLGFCAEPNSGTPSGNFSVSILDDSIEKNANIKAAVLCYVIPELYEALGKNIYNEKDNNTYAYCHALVGYLYSGSLTGLSASMANGVKMMRDTVNAHRQTNPTLISYMQRYQVYVAYNDQQDIVWVEEQQKGSMNLKKESANPEMTDGNSCYSLEGATYGVYKEQACTTKVANLTTDAQGNSNTVEVDAGTYYVKETKAPKGFVLDKQVHPVTVTAGKTAVLKVKDLPQLDPVGVLLGKIDKETNQNKPQGSASLEGAEFTVKYYQALSDSDPGQAGQSPERTWVFRTDKDGFCNYSQQYLVSGDELYLSPTKNPALPLGTVTIQETKAPEGYLINSEIFVIKITDDPNADESVHTYNQPKIPETLLTLDIVKVLKGKDTPIQGVVFLHTDSKGNQEEVTTDEKGQAVLKGLTRGTHTVQEKSVPDGYTKNPGVLKFSVDENNKITLLENTATDKTGTMKFTVREDGTAQLHVEDVLAPYQLIVHKVNDHAKVLEGAEFTLYTDEECKQELQKATSGTDGILRFQDLEVETKYYLKETKAPEGYRIPVNSDGTDIVYEIYTKSDPQKDLFEYYVNGKKYTDTTGDFAITGTKAEREVHLKVVNFVGMQMPETGSPWTLGIVLVGIGCLIVAGYFMKRKGKQEDEEK